MGILAAGSLYLSSFGIKHRFTMAAKLPQDSSTVRRFDAPVAHTPIVGADDLGISDADLVNFALNGIAPPIPDFDLLLQQSESLRRRLREVKMRVLLGISPGLDDFFSTVGSTSMDSAASKSGSVYTLPNSNESGAGSAARLGRELHVVSLSSPVGSRTVTIRDTPLSCAIAKATYDIDQDYEYSAFDDALVHPVAPSDGNQKGASGKVN